MTNRVSGASGNLLIDSLPVKQRNVVVSRSVTVEAALGQVLCVCGKPFENAYFPISGSISVTRRHATHSSLQIRSIGNEGMLGAELILGIERAPDDAVVGLSCIAMCMPSRLLQSSLKESPLLDRCLRQYLYFVLSELSQTAVCMRFHGVRARLARTLLTARDQAPGGDLPRLTHGMLAEMLGVRRGAVTLAAADLQRGGILKYQRGNISILNRRRLEGEACACYRTNRKNYQRVLAP